VNELRGIGWTKEAAEDVLQHLFEALASGASSNASE
jgi:hypothetical protein